MVPRVEPPSCVFVAAVSAKIPHWGMPILLPGLPLHTTVLRSYWGPKIYLPRGRRHSGIETAEKHRLKGGICQRETSSSWKNLGVCRHPASFGRDNAKGEQEGQHSIRQRALFTSASGKLAVVAENQRSQKTIGLRWVVTFHRQHSRLAPTCQG